MKLGQAIISSSGQHASDPNVLLARSPCIDDALTAQLLEWCPRRNGLQFGQRQALAFFQPNRDCFAIARSVSGPMDYQLQRQVISRVVILNHLQLARYYYNGALLAHYLRSMGKLILESDPPGNLPQVELPDRSLPALHEFSRLNIDLEAVMKVFRIHRQVGLMGADRPYQLIAAMLNQLDHQQRMEVSFSIGLRASPNRHFRVQLFQDHDNDLSRELAQLQIRPVNLRQLPKAAAAAV